MKNTFLTILLFFSICQIYLSQNQVKKWYIIQEGLESVLYIDTSTIAKIQDQLSVWILEHYNEPVALESSSLKVTNAKTQYLFNTVKNKYSIIGKLYYDELNRLIGGSSNPGMNLGTDNFYIPIEDNPRVSLVYQKAVEFLNDGAIVNLNDDLFSTSVQIDRNNNDEVKVELQNNSLETTTELPVFQNDKSKIEETLDPKDIETENIQNNNDSNKADNSMLRGIARIYDPASGKYIDLIDSTKISPKTSVQKNKNDDSKNEIKVDKTAKIEFPKTTYDYENERMITNTIFTDGYLYCFQVSSWKNKSIAEREKNRLANSGHNTFIVEANPPHKRGRWYRVRIGYFNTLDETKQYQRKVK
ncbi:SPOR domain-containing protein [Bacteroidota bacterium]